MGLTLPVVSFLGLNLFIWSVIGLIRLTTERIPVGAPFRALARIVRRGTPDALGDGIGWLRARWARMRGRPAKSISNPTLTIACGRVAGASGLEQAPSFLRLRAGVERAGGVVPFAAGAGMNPVLVADLLLGGHPELDPEIRARLDLRIAEFCAPEAVHPVTLQDVAALVPAHNEEIGIRETITSLRRLLPAENIYIGSDASTDRTTEIARSMGVNVADIRPNRGKAGVLAYLVDQFQLVGRYQAVVIVDADSELSPRYFEAALPLFDDPGVVAVAANASPSWPRRRRPTWGGLFQSYRMRLYRLLQLTLRYGQTWRYTNVSPIVPGFASMYRTSALPQIKIDAPGLIIEDFNMTFEIHHKRLGGIAYQRGVFAMSQDPDNFRDYASQVKRWDLGFWQTIRRHGVWPSMFCLSLFFFLMEVMVASVAMLALPVVLIAAFGFGLEFSLPVLGGAPTLAALFIGVFATDYLLTVVIAAIERRPGLLLYGVGFVFLRYVDAILFLYTLPLAFFVRSDGRWTSPKRYEVAGS